MYMGCKANRSLMAEWLKRSNLRDMKCTVHDQEIIGSNPCRFELGVRSTSV